MADTTTMEETQPTRSQVTLDVPRQENEDVDTDLNMNTSRAAYIDEPGFGPQPVDPETGERLFRLPVDDKHRAMKLQWWRFDKPHMRAFFFAWATFFTAFFGWFAVAPLMPTIKNSTELGLTSKQARANSNVIAVAGTVLTRLVTGPLADRFGPRIPYMIIMVVFSLPVYLIGTAFNYASFCTARFFIGFLGGSFVLTSFWTTQMFSPSIVGTANATAAGWGNLGGGVTNALMPQFFNLMKAFGLNDDKAWRVVMVIPGTMCASIGILLYFFAQDLPDGNYKQLHASGALHKTNPWIAMRRAALNIRSWVLFVLYATCFGVELVMNNTLATYFTEQFGVDQGLAGLIAGLFGLMNLFARALGGISSDFCSKRWGMTGRLWVFFAVQCLEGLALILFSRMTVLGAAIPVLIIFSTFVQMSEGATFGVVPFVDPTATASISGIVGAGGNVGAVTLGLVFSYVDSQPTAMLILGCIVVGCSFTVFLLMVGPFKVIDTQTATAVSAKNIDDELVERTSSRSSEASNAADTN
mmetsp:Transcript_4301/g.7876  ORF Transcript_4301/g.7876 Transcript_4301/m.7876 type:complete len:527 (+) Transcript_4301:260-1840(+)